MHPRFGTINLRLVSACPPLGAALSADLAPLINGALFAAELCIFSAQFLGILAVSLFVFGFAAVCDDRYFSSRMFFVKLACA